MPHSHVKRHARSAVIQPSTFDTTQADKKELSDASATSKVSFSAEVFVIT